MVIPVRGNKYYIPPNWNDRYEPLEILGIKNYQELWNVCECENHFLWNSLLPQNDVFWQVFSCTLRQGSVILFSLFLHRLVVINRGPWKYICDNTFAGMSADLECAGRDSSPLVGRHTESIRSGCAMLFLYFLFWNFVRAQWCTFARRNLWGMCGCGRLVSANLRKHSCDAAVAPIYRTA